jgi:fibronectin type 3 domain-containing protein
VTISAATLSGSGFTDSGVTYPLTLNPNQTATINIVFDPTAAGAMTGQLTLVSNSSTGTSTLISLSGTGVVGSGTSPTYAVDLSWNAPSSSPDPVTGYNVFRSPSGAASYALLNTAVVTQTTYTDTTVQNGQSYDYIVESVNASGVASAPSNTTTAVIP